MFTSKIFILDDNQEKITCRQAADKINEECEADGRTYGNCRDSNIRYYIKARRAKTLSDIRKIRKKMIDEGERTFEKRVTHKAKVNGKVGFFTLRELHAVHPHKDELKLSALSTRISINGAMNEKIWEKPSRSSKNKKTKTCKCCERKRGRKFFLEDKKSNDLLSIYCIDCTETTPTKQQDNSKKQKTIKKVLSVPRGTIVTLNEKDFEVVECYPIRGMKAELSCHRIMADGQVLRRSTVKITGNWQVR